MRKLYFSDAEEQPTVDGVSLIYYILYHERLENTISSCFCRLYNLHYEKFADGSVKCIEDEIPFELPDGWAWARVNQIYNFIDYRGATPNKITSGVALITAKNVKSGYIDYTIDEYISEEEYWDRQQRGTSRLGDPVLGSRYNTVDFRNFYLEIEYRLIECQVQSCFLHSNLNCSLYSVLADYVDDNTVVLWVDAMGAEWLPLLSWTISQNCDATVQSTSIVQANLPTETCYNDLWKEMDIPFEKLDKLDKLAHKGVIDEPDYYACVEELIQL